MTEKQCSKCGEVKHIDEYPKDKSKKCGYRPQCKKCTKEWKKEWYSSNSERVNKQSVARILDKRKTDPYYNMIYKIRERTRKAIKRGNLSKNNSTLKMLGCDKNTLMEHLQKTAIQYDSNFNIYDYDSTLYHIDHIKTFEDVSKGIYTLDEVCHYTNLQILPAKINLSKGGNSW